MRMKRIAVAVMLVAASAAVAACSDSPTALVSAAPSVGSIASNISIQSFSAIDNPDAAYLAATTKIDFSALADEAWPVSSITDGTETVTFLYGLEKRTVGYSWPSWSSPPSSESATPAVLVDGFGNENTLTISGPETIQTFGFELQGNSYVTSEFTARFYSGATLVGTVTRSVHGFEGARLFAICTGKGSITSVVAEFTGGTDPDGYAIGQVRYGTGSLCGGKAPKPPKPPKP